MLAFLLIVSFHEVILGADEHAFQQIIECAFNSQGQVDRSWRYGYDGKDVMHVDLASETVVGTSEIGKRLAEERKSTEYIRRKEEKLKIVCSAVKTVFQKSNNSLSMAAKPAVLLFYNGDQGREYLKCVVRGFYPNVIRVGWTQNGKPIYFGVSTTGILPHTDGTFQMTSYLSLSNVTAHGVTCVIEHLSIDGKLRKSYGDYPGFLSQITGAVVAFILGFALPMCPTAVIFVWKRHQTTKSHDDETNGASDASEASLSLNVMNISQET
ncbi:mamu class II histocompatibility antigen, DR alpha chain [Danio aesculapii]|uniref:mamu class II histocompatibility antigen, DR alpha chain n=1 Tax=Danio aesculapii TaxID=1142201 RepID=UPI0024C097BE|nr:mamu class II histocompatibility antigen, DR alpha chain [Danio aesculapii]